MAGNVASATMAGTEPSVTRAARAGGAPQHNQRSRREYGNRAHGQDALEVEGPPIHFAFASASAVWASPWADHAKTLLLQR
jgi:hypothetical protein